MILIPVILSGGSGTRLWPLSTTKCPKQFLPLVTDNTMIQETLLRLSGVESVSPIVVCNKDHRFLVAEGLKELCSNPSIMLEPCARNTAPAIACACMCALEKDPDAVMVVLPSDHVIKDKEAFIDALKIAGDHADNGAMVTFGIVPDLPHTGYGYIKKGSSDGEGAYILDKFVEKPNLEKAKEYLASGEYLWNSGMFVFRADTFLSELQSFDDDMYSLSQEAYRKAVKDTDFIRLDEEAFSKIKGNSIDYAVMEKTTLGKVVPLDAGWNDVGSYTSLYDISNKDENDCVIKGKACVMDSSNLYINSKKKVCALGVKDLIIVEGEDEILVTTFEASQDVKKLKEKSES